MEPPSPSSHRAGRVSYFPALALIGALALASGFSGCEAWDGVMSAAGLGGGEKEKPKPPPGPVTAPAAVVFEGVSADGGGRFPTTALTLYFSDVIDGLSAGGVTLTPVGDNNSGITKGALEGEGPSYTLYVGNVAADGWST